jgi:hypothetical protein
MSKGLGQKIVIKFTEDLVGDVSGKGTATPYSFYRWYITSTWSSSGRLYLYELEFFSDGIKVNTNKIISMAGSSRYSSSYDVDRLFDGSVPGTEWDANGSLPHWVSIELDEAVAIDSFRWHTGTSSNKPKEFILQGSNDGINWVDIYTDESPNLNNWIDFAVTGAGNEIAFTVTGQEYQYVNGPMIDKEYRVVKVERYPIQRVWELGESLALDLPGEMSLTDAQCYTGSGITSLTGTVYANDGDIVLATATHRGVFTPPDGWEFLYESSTIGTVNHRMIVFKKYIDESGLVSFTGKQNISQSMYLNLISISGISDIIFAPELESIYRGGVKPAPMPDKQEGEKIIWGATVSLYATSPPYGGWSTTPDDLTIIHLDQSSYAPRLVNLIDFGNGQANNRTIMQSPSTTETDVNIAGFKVIQNYSTPKIYTSQVIQLDGEYRLRWNEGIKAQKGERGWRQNSFGTGSPVTGTRGYKFKLLNNSIITALRVMSAEEMTTVHLWDAETQKELIRVTHATDKGVWNVIQLPQPIAIKANKEYVVTANVTSGDNNYYRNAAATQEEFNPNLEYLGHVYSEQHNTYPTISLSWANAVDIIFTQVDYSSVSVKVEYTTGEEQGQWQEINNGGVLVANKNLWLRVTLETENTEVTPILQDLWLEEPEAPNDQIRLVMYPQSRFNNVEGSLTVQYDQSKGSLRGRGGIVKEFTETFMPTDLEPKPNPHVAENIEVSAEVNVSFTKVTYNQRYADEQITVSATVTVDFIYVGIINP